MTFEEANEKIKFCSEDAMKAFGCSYFHNICIKCKHKPQCYRKEPLIKECNFYDSEEAIEDAYTMDCLCKTEDCTITTETIEKMTRLAKGSTSWFEAG